MTTRPNILLITSDQQRADCFGFENRHIKTPHIDLLATQGTRFATCVTPNLVCQPSRASILTGLLPLSHGVWDNGVDLNPQVGEAGFAGTLAAHGYHTAFIGKAHFSTKSTFSRLARLRPLQRATMGPWRGPYASSTSNWRCRAFHRTRPLNTPVGHYERWLLSRLPDDRVHALGPIACPDVGQLGPGNGPRGLAFQFLIAELRVIAYDCATLVSFVYGRQVIPSTARSPGAACTIQRIWCSRSIVSEILSAAPGGTRLCWKARPSSLIPPCSSSGLRDHVCPRRRISNWPT